MYVDRYAQGNQLLPPTCRFYQCTIFDETLEGSQSDRGVYIARSLEYVFDCFQKSEDSITIGKTGIIRVFLEKIQVGGQAEIQQKVVPV
jgi:hypothetical protein